MAAESRSLPPDDAEQGPPASLVDQATRQSQLDFDIEFFDSVLTRNPYFVDVVRCQAELLSRRGWHDRALVLDRRLVELRPDDCVACYNLACSLAVVGYRLEAIATLRQALETGYDDLEFLAGDADLETLHDEPEYQALLAEYTRPRRRKARATR